MKLCQLEFLAFFFSLSLASHLLSLAALRFGANWPSVSSIVRRHWCSRWHWKSLRCLQKSEVLALVARQRKIVFAGEEPMCVCVCLFVAVGAGSVCYVCASGARITA